MLVIRYRAWRPAILLPAIAFASLCLLGWAVQSTWESVCNPVSIRLCVNLWASLIPVLVALGYWAAGIVLWWRHQVDLRLEFFWVVASVLAAGQLSTIPIDLGQRIFYALLSLLAPLTLHCHVQWIISHPGFTERLLITKFYITGTLFALPFVIWPFRFIQSQNWYSLLWGAVRLHLVIALLVTIAYLFWMYRRSETPLEARRQIRTMALGVCAGLGPLIIFSLLPDTLGAAVRLPYNMAFPALLLLPIIYVLRQQHPIWLNVLPVDRSATLYLLLLVVGALGLATATTLVHLVPQIPLAWLLASLFLVIFLLLVSLPLQRLITWLLHGHERQLRQQLGQMTAELALTLDRSQLKRLLTEQLATILAVEDTAFYIREECYYTSLGVLPPSLSECLPSTIAAGNALISILNEAPTPLAPRQLQERLQQFAVTCPQQMDETVAKWATAPVALWLPLISAATLQGILVIGRRYNGREFSTTDCTNLAGLAFQAAAAVHNTHLVTVVQATHDALSTAHRQLLLVREQERRQIAHDLHDGAVQQLLGISYQVYALQRQTQHHNSQNNDGIGLGTTLQEIRRELLKVTSQLRLVIGELHPASLEILGLGAALEEYLASLGQQRPDDLPRIRLSIDKTASSLSSVVAICLYRCAQEAIRNALRHAHAQQMQIQLAVTHTHATLVVRDDGKGFVLEANALGKLAQSHHFGLMSMQERVRALDGEIQIATIPSKGTAVTICVPLRGASQR